MASRESCEVPVTRTPSRNIKQSCQSFTFPSTSLHLRANRNSHVRDRRRIHLARRSRFSTRLIISPYDLHLERRCFEFSPSARTEQEADEVLLFLVSCRAADLDSSGRVTFSLRPKAFLRAFRRRFPRVLDPTESRRRADSQTSTTAAFSRLCSILTSSRT